MIPIERFSLERHAGPYESWPVRSRLFADGAPTEILLSGYDLLHQFETADGYLLVADHQSPYEEATTFALVSRDLRLLSERTLAAPYATFLLDALRWTDEHRLVATFHGDLHYEVTIRERGIPFLRPRLKLKRMR